MDQQRSTADPPTAIRPLPASVGCRRRGSRRELHALDLIRRRPHPDVVGSGRCVRGRRAPAGPPEGCQSVARGHVCREGRVCGASSLRPWRSAPSSLRSTATPPPDEETASDSTVLLCCSGSRSPAAVASLHRQAPTLLRRCGAGLAHIFHDWRRCWPPSTAFTRPAPPSTDGVHHASPRAPRRRDVASPRAPTAPTRLGSSADRRRGEPPGSTATSASISLRPS